MENNFDHRISAVSYDWKTAELKFGKTEFDNILNNDDDIIKLNSKIFNKDKYSEIVNLTIEEQKKLAMKILKINY